MILKLLMMIFLNYNQKFLIKKNNYIWKFTLQYFNSNINFMDKNK